MWLRTGIITLAFTAVLFFFLTRHPDHGPLHLWDLPAEQLTSVEVHTPEHSYEVRHDTAAKTWCLVAPAGCSPLEGTRVEAWLHPILHPHAKSILGVSAPIEDYTPYGLVENYSEISLHAATGTTLKLWVGKVSPLQDNYYAKKPDAPTVYLFPIYDLRQILQGDLANLAPTDKVDNNHVNTPPESEK